MIRLRVMRVGNQCSGYYADQSDHCWVSGANAVSDENKIRDLAEAVKGVVEAVPIYEDALQPAAKEIGTALQTVAKTIHIALAPVSALVWGYDQIKDFVSTKVAEKLKDVPSGKTSLRQSPM